MELMSPYVRELITSALDLLAFVLVDETFLVNTAFYKGLSLKLTRESISFYNVVFDPSWVARYLTALC